MAQVQRFSRQVIDAAERLADMADAAEGKGSRRSGMGTRWLLLPAAGAGLYALATRGSVRRQAKGVLHQAKVRASELPEDLFHRVQQTTGLADNGRKDSRQTSQRSGSRSSGRQRSRKASSAR